MHVTIEDTTKRIVGKSTYDIELHTGKAAKVDIGHELEVLVPITRIIPNGVHLLGGPNLIWIRCCPISPAIRSPLCL